MIRHARPLPRSERTPVLRDLVLTTTSSGVPCFAERLGKEREQLLIPTLSPLAVLPPRIAIVQARSIDEALRTARAEQVAREQLLLDFTAPRRPLISGGTPRSLPVVRERGGPDPARPCDGCAMRARCRAPCELLAAQLAPEEIIASNEISSPALMAGRGYDPQFMTFPTVEDGPVEEEDELWPHVVAMFGPRLHEAIPLLTRAQQEVVGMLLAGRSRSEVGRIRGTKRQVTHKILHAALRALTRELGPLPSSMQARRS